MTYDHIRYVPQYERSIKLNFFAAKIFARGTVI